MYSRNASALNISANSVIQHGMRNKTDELECHQSECMHISQNSPAQATRQKPSLHLFDIRLRLLNESVVRKMLVRPARPAMKRLKLEVFR